MKQVVQSARTGKTDVREVPAPDVADGHLLVRTRASLISAGTERLIVDFAKKNLVSKARARPDLVKKVMDKARRDGIAETLRSVFARLDEPLPLGYSAAGIVEAVGGGLEGRFRVGQRVAMAGAGIANHAEVNLVPGNLAAPVPDDVNDEEACFGTVAAIALHGVRNLDLAYGDWAAVVGCGLVGQLAIQFLDLAGIRVVALDYAADRLELARYGGAEIVWNLGDGDPAQGVFEATGGRGCDGVLIAASTDSNEPFMTAAALARDRATVSLVGLTGTEIPYREFMQKELSVTVSRSYGPGRYDDDFEQRGMKYPVGFVRWTESRNLEHALHVMSRQKDHRLAVEQLITHRYDIGEAEKAYGLIMGGGEPHLGVVITYPRDETEARPKLRVPVSVSAAPSRGSEGQCVLGMIGAGNFARVGIMPRLKNLSGCRLKTLVSARGLTAEDSADKFGFEQADAVDTAVLDDPEINAVVIATRHAEHAALTAAALKAGKCVYVEKPMALTREELETISRARLRSSGFYTIGFNRRFAPMTEKAQAFAAVEAGPKFVVMRISGGAVPADHWVNAPEEGGGRVLGELCHFVDLARAIVGAPVASVHAVAAKVNQGGCDDVTATLHFEDGSLATIAYTALGDGNRTKERIEVHAGGRTVEIEDFRKYTGPDGKTDTASQDKGHTAALKAFADAAASGGPAPVDETELFETSLASIAVVEALRTGAAIRL